ncbi:MAG: TlyA family RNA methyltransferase [Syntrophales bacterium]|nr:TlyA family RNA methyltransferase [Syntrophales bacterium]
MGAVKERLDRIVLTRGLASDERAARALILSGNILVNGHPVDKIGKMVAKDAQIQLRGGERKHPYVSRGGVKLKSALDAFGIIVQGKIAIDIGASTGGFTDCLLQEGAKKVYAIDVGYGQLAWKLRRDPRVVPIERTNIRTFDPTTIIGDVPELAVIDVSFISLRLVIPAVKRILPPRGQIIALVKPQFEAPREWIEKGGILKDPTAKEAILKEITIFCQNEGIEVIKSIPSPLLGPAGNEEFFIYGIKGE